MNTICSLSWKITNEGLNLETKGTREIIRKINTLIKFTSEIVI